MVGTMSPKARSTLHCFVWLLAAGVCAWLSGQEGPHWRAWAIYSYFGDAVALYYARQAWRHGKK
jgi:hypothetical protein